jgi:molybdopterin-containing oxidoreductase family membrane subunit
LRIGWLASLAFAFMMLNILAISAAYLLYRGLGIWGINVPVSWGFAIVNFVWWIGIGHAGTLISAILLLLRQRLANEYQPIR